MPDPQDIAAACRELKQAEREQLEQARWDAHCKSVREEMERDPEGHAEMNRQLQEKMAALLAKVSPDEPALGVGDAGNTDGVEG